MATKTLIVELSEDLYRKFIETVTEKGGLWRKKETDSQAIQSAVSIALMFFLQSLSGEGELPEFREYAGEKYPELDEDLITMIEDLIKRQREAHAPKPRTINNKMSQKISRREIEKKHPHFFD